jgi:hypothetical protein
MIGRKRRKKGGREEKGYILVMIYVMMANSYREMPEAKPAACVARC